MRISTTRIVAAVIISLSLAVGVQADDQEDFSFDWYGYIKLDGAYDQNLTSHGNFVMWVNPGLPDAEDEQFNMTANETRFGLTINQNTDASTRVRGQIEFDLYASVGGGPAENKAMLQLRHAYFAIEHSSFQLLAGQSWDLISPLNAPTLNYPVLWGVGNIGYRRPQISVWATFGNSRNTVTTAAGVFRTIGSDLTPTFSLAAGETSEGPDDGTDAGMPSVQGRLDLTHKLSDGTTLRWGGSGLYGKLKAETNFGNYEEYESIGYAGHLALTVNSRFGLLGEVYAGDNLGSYFGAILNANTVDGLTSKGGWGALWVQAHPKVKLSAGAGMDDPEDTELSSGDRAKNRAIFGNIRFSVVPQATVGVEVSHWETEYKNNVTADNLRAQTSFILNF